MARAEVQGHLVSAPLNLSQYQWALFAENEWRIVDDLALTLGARYDRNEQFGGKWSPRGYLVWNATPAWTFKGGVSKGYKTPDINLMTDGIIGLGAQGTAACWAIRNCVPKPAPRRSWAWFTTTAQA
ncbi:TonB-dependent receptor [Achromobacter xylosoxidans]